MKNILKIAFVALVAVVAVALFINQARHKAERIRPADGVLEKANAPFSTLPATRFVTSSGLQLATFFVGLPPNARIRESVLHPKHPEKSSCGQSSDKVARIMNALGLGHVVYAQDCTTCKSGEYGVGCFAASIENIDCSADCGYGGQIIWYTDDNSPWGYYCKPDEISCNSDLCYNFYNCSNCPQ